MSKRAYLSRYLLIIKKLKSKPYSTLEEISRYIDNRLLEPLVAFIDDIFEVIRSSNKKTALAFIELLALGSQQSIHFIAASSGIYKPLLNQLIHLNPGLIQRLNKANPKANFDKPLSPELVMNPDGLIFFKERNEYVFTRLYPLRDERLSTNY